MVQGEANAKQDAKQWIKVNTQDPDDSVDEARRPRGDLVVVEQLHVAGVRAEEGEGQLVTLPVPGRGLRREA